MTVTAEKVSAKPKANPFSQVFPFEKNIRKRKFSEKPATNRLIKQSLVTFSNLAPALTSIELLKPFEVNKYLAVFLSLAAMHSSNKGTEKMNKLALYTGSALGVTAVQERTGMPRPLVRSVMGTLIFLVDHFSGSTYSGPYVKHLKSQAKDGEEVETKRVNRSLEKKDWAKLLKLQILINAIPAPVRGLKNMIGESVSQNFDGVKKAFAHIGNFALFLVSMTAGFIGLGKGIDKLFDKIGFADELELIDTGAEMVPVMCPAEAAAEVASENTSLAITHF